MLCIAQKAILNFDKDEQFWMLLSSYRELVMQSFAGKAITDSHMELCLESIFVHRELKVNCIEDMGK